MATITAKQISYISALVSKTGAQDSGRSMTVGMKTYPHLSIGKALAGSATTSEASQIIKILSATAPASYASAKQTSYIEFLARKAGRKVYTYGITTAEASALIDELKRA